jgi:hypothetical protein
VMKSPTTIDPFLTQTRITHASALALLINVDLIGVQPLCFPFMPG